MPPTPPPHIHTHTCTQTSRSSFIATQSWSFHPHLQQRSKSSLWLPSRKKKRKNDTEVSSLWEMLHEGPDRPAQYVSEGWLATADSQEDPGIWIRDEPRTTWNKFLVKLTKFLKLFSGRLNFWFFLATKHWINRYLECLTLRCSSFNSCPCAVTMHSQRLCRLQADKRLKNPFIFCLFFLSTAEADLIKISESLISLRHHFFSRKEKKIWTSALEMKTMK